ncbi:MAG TPA: hypothetical protein VIT68_01070, partial [Candidatus Gracilibacteria bacterium]
VLSIIHNGTATITAWDSEIRWSGGSAPTLTGTSGYVDIISCVYRSAPSSRYFCSPMLNFDPS